MKLPPSQDVLLSLAPDGLKTYRSSRYRGDDVCVSLSGIGIEDQRRIRVLYERLQEIFVGTANGEVVKLEAFVSSGKGAELLEMVMQIGGDAPRDSTEIARALHDIVGGALTALLGRLQMIAAGIPVASQARVVFLLARDHLKIMRNILLGLDDGGRQKDTEDRRHSSRLLAEKWHNAEIYFENKKSRILFDSEFEGDISERCIEFGSLDRVLYNLVNNALRHTSEPVLSISLVSVPGAPEPNLRFVVANPIAPDHADRIEEAFNSPSGGIFRKNFSTTGSGLGLGICGLIVANAYGLQSVDQAVDQQYLGARVQDDHFLSWFHWPIVA